MLTRRVMDDSGPQLIKGWWVALVGVGALFVGLLAALGTWVGFQAGPGPSPDPALLTQLGSDLVDPRIRYPVRSCLHPAAGGPGRRHLHCGG